MPNLSKRRDGKLRVSPQKHVETAELPKGYKSDGQFGFFSPIEPEGSTVQTRF